MGKAARNRAQAAVVAAQERLASGGGAPPEVFPEFPYQKKMTRAQVADITARSEALGKLMRDPLMVTGAHAFMPEDIFQLWMVHGVMAGADGGTPYIRGRTIPDEHGALADRTEWVLLSADSEEQRAADADAEAAAHIAALENSDRLRPEVRAAIRRRLREAAVEANEYLADDPDGAARRSEPTDFGAPRLIEHKDDVEEAP